MDDYIYLRFFKTKSLTAFLISTWTGDWPSHVEFVVGKGSYLSSDITTGVAMVDDEYYKDDEFSRMEYFKVKVTKEQKDIIMAAAESQLGKGYDTFALVGNMFRRNWQSTEKWFCSEHVSWSFNEGKHSLIVNRTNRITPGDLLMSPRLIPCNDEFIVSNG